MTPDVKAEDLPMAARGNFVAPPEAVNVYRCDAGHETRVQGKYHALIVSDPSGEHHYDFCSRCWGEWMAKQWPLRERALIADGWIRADDGTLQRAEK